MFYIENSHVTLMGHSVTYYAVMPVMAMLAITACGCWFAKKKKIDISFMFRVSLILYGAGAIGFLYQDRVPDFLLPFLYAAGNAGVIAGYGICGKMFRQNVVQCMSFGAVSYFLLSFFTKIGCFLTGCCYGIPCEGPLSVVYGSTTMHPHPGTSCLAIQLLVALVHLILGVSAFLWILKKDSKILPFFLLFTNMFVYHVGKIFQDPVTNQTMIVGGVNMIGIMSVITLIGMAGCLIVLVRQQRRKKDA